MLWLLAALGVIILLFGFVLLFGAPYLPTLTPQVGAALELADLKPGQTLLELGCGDGKVLIAAAQGGLHVVGYELNPLLALISWLRTRRFKGRVHVVWGNFWAQEWPPAEALFVFLHPRFMRRLDTKVVQTGNRVRLISFAFTVPGREPTHQKRGVYRYDYYCSGDSYCGTINAMNKHNQDGAINALLLPLILAVIFFVAALGFGFWAFAGRQDYKNNSDAKVAAAVADAKQEESTSKDKQFAEISKLPLKTYNGPDEYGSLKLQYPKTWSGYVVTGSSSSSPLDGYFSPDVVPSVTDQNSTFALRAQVVSQTYDNVLRSFSSNKDVVISPFAFAKVPGTVGVKIQGQIDTDKQGTMIIVPLRDKTLQLSTESQTYQADFDNSIVPNLSFAP